MGGGGFMMEPANSALDDFILTLARTREPKILFLPTASGDPNAQISSFRATFGDRACRPLQLSLFRLEQNPANLRELILAQDIVYVGGGSMRNLLAIWREHGIDEVLRECWLRGIVLCGLSAGSLCWFADAVTAFHGPPQRIPGLGLLPYSNCVHYDGEPARRASYHQFLSEGMPPGYAASDGAALHFRGESLAGVVSSRPQATACWVEEVGGDISEVALPVRWLGESRTLTAA